MKELIEKISSYNLFNYLFPGIVFVIILRSISPYDFYQENNLIGVFLYYFIGLTISRFGSLVIEPTLKKAAIVKFIEYKRYIIAADIDNRIELFSEINNMYRTIMAMLAVVLLAKLYESIESYLNLSAQTTFFILIVALFIIFVLSYRKQTSYLVNRVESRTEETNKTT